MNRHPLFLPLLASLFTAASLLTAACLPKELVDTREPTQTERENPLASMGKKDLDQRQRDCWDMPNAAACYEVGMSYELGTTVPKDASKAHEYYAKACEISRDPEHCRAAGEPMAN
ncbi:MAG: SEL1-like repeat protein [Polyangiaceae bacterium]